MEDGDPVIEITTDGVWEPRRNRNDALVEHGRGLALMRELAELELLVDDGRVTIRVRLSKS